MNLASHQKIGKENEKLKQKKYFFLFCGCPRQLKRLFPLAATF